MTSNLALHSMLVLHVSPKSGCLRGAMVLHPSPRSAGRCRGRAAGTRGGRACARALPGAILLLQGLARDRAAPRPPPGRTPSLDFARSGSPRGCRSASSPGFPPAQLAGGARFFRSRSPGQNPAGDTARGVAEAPAPPLQPLPRSPRPWTPRSTALTGGGHGGRSGRATKQKSLLNSGREAGGGDGDGTRTSAAVRRPHLSSFTRGDRRRAARPAERAAAR